VLIEEPTDVVDTYFRQCAITVTCADLALMGATLANQGINPMTGARAIEGKHVENVLSVMASCGMYDFSGGWSYKIGMPAKSGVSGGVLAVLPGQTPLLSAVRVAHGIHHNGTCSATTVGEMAFLDRARRSADVVAEDEGACAVFEVDDFFRLQQTNPILHSKILRNIGISLATKLRKANQDVSILSALRD